MDEIGAMILADQEGTVGDPLEIPYYEKGWFKALYIYLIIQAVFGILVTEYAFSKAKKFMTHANEQYTDTRLEQIKRQDAKRWARWKIYPVAMLTCLTRMLLFVINALVLITFVKLWTCCHNFNKGPIKKGCRQTLIDFQFRFAGKCFMFLAGVCWSTTDKDADYSYYLGPDYKEKMSKRYASTVISNHVSWFDGMVIACRVLPSMTPKASMRNTPIISLLGKAIGVLWTPQGGTQESRENALNMIRERQELVEQEGAYPPLLIYPEGTTSNGKFLYSFKKGAFINEKKIRPFILKYSTNGVVNPCWDVIDIKPLIFLQHSWYCQSVKMLCLPDFEPNEYLFETHKDKGATRWEIYAWAMRQIYKEHGGFELSTLTFREKQNYSNYMNNRKGRFVHPDEFYLQMQENQQKQDEEQKEQQNGGDKNQHEGGLREPLLQ